MARPLSSKRSPTSEALIELRKRLGESQQSFSNRLGVALQTVTRWETSNPPNGAALSRLGALAVQCGHSDLSRTFLEAAIDEFLTLNEEFNRTLTGGLAEVIGPRVARDAVDLVARTLASMTEPRDATAREKKHYKKLRALEKEVKVAREICLMSYSLLDPTHRKYAVGEITPNVETQVDPLQRMPKQERK